MRESEKQPWVVSEPWLGEGRASYNFTIPRAPPLETTYFAKYLMQ